MSIYPGYELIVLFKADILKSSSIKVKWTIRYQSKQINPNLLNEAEILGEHHNTKLNQGVLRGKAGKEMDMNEEVDVAEWEKGKFYDLTVKLEEKGIIKNWAGVFQFGTFFYLLCTMLSMLSRSNFVDITVLMVLFYLVALKQFNQLGIRLVQYGIVISWILDIVWMA